MNSLRSNGSTSSFVRPGKQAIEGQHRARFVETRQHQIASSVDFEAMTEGLTGPARVDYLIESSACPGRIHAVEIHSFSPTDLRDKKVGTLRLLHTLCPDAISEIRTWSVIVQGTSPRQDQAARLFAETKVMVAGRQLRVPQLCPRKKPA